MVSVSWVENLLHTDSPVVMKIDSKVKKQSDSVKVVFTCGAEQFPRCLTVHTDGPNNPNYHQS